MSYTLDTQIQENVQMKFYKISVTDITCYPFHDNNHHNNRVCYRLWRCS